MKATLIFDLDEPYDKEAHFRAVKSLDMAMALHDIVGLRKQFERQMDMNTDVPQEWVDTAMDSVFDRICEILEDRGIVVDDLVS